MSEQAPPSDEQLSIVPVCSHEEDIGKEDADKEGTYKGETQEEKRNGFKDLSTEAILMIFESMHSIRDVVAMARTCRRAYTVFRGCGGPIAKVQILRMTVGYYKLPIMAIASRDVDATDKASIERFFRDYIQRPTPWPLSYFSMDTAKALTLLLRAGERLFEGMFAYRSYTEEIKYLATPTELARAVRTACMLETASNLFHRRPGADSELIGAPLYPELELAYWELFSYWEFEQLIVISNGLRGVQRNIIKRELRGNFPMTSEPDAKAQGFCCHLLNRRYLTDNYHYHYRQHEDAGAFALLVGIENLYKWVTWQTTNLKTKATWQTNNPLPNPFFKHLKEFMGKLSPQHETVYGLEAFWKLEGSIRHGRTRFQPDPDVMDATEIYGLWEMAMSAKRGKPDSSWVDVEAIKLWDAESFKNIRREGERNDCLHKLGIW